MFLDYNIWKHDVDERWAWEVVSVDEEDLSETILVAGMEDTQSQAKAAALKALAQRKQR